MIPSIQKLGGILYSPSQYIIPIFQRNYRWERREWIKLCESLDEIRKPEKIGNHFMGFLVFIPETAQPGQNNKFHMIDGQQRLTTLSLFLIAIRNVARRLKQEELGEEIHQYYLVHPLKKGDEHYRLLPKERDRDTYLALINGKGEPTGRLADAVSYFEREIEDRIEGDLVGLRGLFNVLVQRLEFMCATLETENAYNIFKSLNSTGVPLGAADLIRNFVFMHVVPENHDEFDGEYWTPLESGFVRADGTFDEERFSRFFRDFLMSSGRYVPPGETFPTFEARYEATDFSAERLTQALLEASSDYEVIVGVRNDSDPEVTQAIAELNAFESPTTYPLLLALFAQRRRVELTSSDLLRAIRMLSGFIFRRSVCGESSRGYGQIFVRALTSLSPGDISGLEAYLYERGWPDDIRFKTAFIGFSLYTQRYGKHILELLEKSRGHKEPASLADTQIEHVLPQTLNVAWRNDLGEAADQLQATWLHSPGNLTLSGYNAELWNHPFNVKRQRYAQSNVVLTRELADVEQWNEQTIRSRGEHLAAEAAILWVGPSADMAAAIADVTSSLDLATRRSLAALKALRGRRQKRLEYLEGDARTQAEIEIARYNERIDRLMRLPAGEQISATVTA